MDEGPAIVARHNGGRGDFMSCTPSCSAICAHDDTRSKHKGSLSYATTIKNPCLPYMLCLRHSLCLRARLSLFVESFTCQKLFVPL